MEITPHLAPSAALTPDILDALGKEIAAKHQSSVNSVINGAVAAVECGVLLVAAKSCVPRDGFGAWCDQQGFSFSKMTRSKYIRLATRLCEETDGKPDLLVSVQRGRDGQPVHFEFDEEKVRALIGKVSGHGLTELYTKWGITKQPQGQLNGCSPHAQPNGNDNLVEPLTKCIDSLESIKKTIPHLNDMDRSKLACHVKALLAKLETVPQE